MQIEIIKTFEQFIKEFVEWSVPTFANATPLSSLKKADEEIKEIAHEIVHGHENLAEEYADAIMCLFDSAARVKVTPDKIIEAFGKKLEINKQRKWVKNLDNTYSHIK